MCVEQGTQQRQEQQRQAQNARMHEQRDQQAQAEVHQEYYVAQYLQNKGGQYAQDARKAYLEQTAHMQDTAQLGKKSFKSNTKEKKLRNERIDRAKLMTDRATAYTLDVYDQMKEVCDKQQERKKARSRLAKQKVEFLKTVGKLSDNTTEQQAAFFFRMRAVEEHFYSPEMFLTSNIHVKENFMEYHARIEEYDDLMKKYQRDPDAYAPYAEDIQGLVDHLGPVIEALRHRLQVYCEQNRVSLNGEILDETAESAHLSDNDITDWFEKVREYNQWKHHFNVSGGPLSDEERENFREMRAEAGRQENLQNRQHAQPWQRTRGEAVSTDSDLLEQNSRQELRRMNRRLHEAGMTDVAKIVHEYVVGTRYAVGYTEERKRLKKAIAAVDEALAKESDNLLAVHQLHNIHDYFAQMTNGTLYVPADAQIIDCTERKLEETGVDGAGSTRNAMIRDVMYWSDQKDTPLFSHEPVVNDLKQRLVSNCYMVAGTTGLVNVDPQQLKNCIRDNGDGTVTVRLFEYEAVQRQNAAEQEPAQGGLDADDLDGFEAIDLNEIVQYELRPVYVKVTKEIPRIAGMDALSAGALWMQMIEKACAYLGRDRRTGYQSLWYGEGGSFLERLLGIPREMVNKDTPEDQDALFEGILHAAENRIIYHAGTYNEKNAADANDTDGLNTGHAYAVLGGKVENGQRYVLLRNPYSTNSLKYQEDGGREKTGSSLSVSSDETYGQFYMKFEEFVRDFRTVSYTDLNRHHA
ncbi:MAG: C2 family cysteine protease [bacterium]|nr:C2 family cysteine protease [bacterium]MDY4100983.1 C2 family cysteine protease [Lachnospiraceae bacterium]